jgi:hypothetical protein
MRKFIAAILIATLGIFTSVAIADDGGKGDNDKDHVTICHATGTPDNAGNGYVVISPSASGVFHGHLRQHDADIIPPFEFQGVTYSQNWDNVNNHVAIWKNGCKPVTVPTTTTTPTTPTTTVVVTTPTTTATTPGTTTTVTSPTVTTTTPTQTVTVTTPTQTVTTPTQTVTTSKTVTVPAKVTKPVKKHHKKHVTKPVAKPVKKHKQVLPTPPKKATVKPHVFPFTP